MWSEFKKFAFKGNVMDMAVGVMIGAAFNGIVSSIVNDVFMPLFGLIFESRPISARNSSSSKALKALIFPE